MKFSLRQPSSVNGLHRLVSSLHHLLVAFTYHWFSVDFVIQWTSSVIGFHLSPGLSSIIGYHQSAVFVNQWPSLVSGFTFINQWHHSMALVNYLSSLVSTLHHQRLSWNIQPSSDTLVILYQSLVSISQRPSTDNSLHHMLAFIIS
jgi:hypothetical protein